MLERVALLTDGPRSPRTCSSCPPRRARTPPPPPVVPPAAVARRRPARAHADRAPADRLEHLAHRGRARDHPQHGAGAHGEARPAPATRRRPRTGGARPVRGAPSAARRDASRHRRAPPPPTAIRWESPAGHPALARSSSGATRARRSDVVLDKLTSLRRPHRRAEPDHRRRGLRPRAGGGRPAARGPRGHGGAERGGARARRRAVHGDHRDPRRPGPGRAVRGRSCEIDSEAKRIEWRVLDPLLRGRPPRAASWPARPRCPSSLAASDLERREAGRRRRFTTSRGPRGAGPGRRGGDGGLRRAPAGARPAQQPPGLGPGGARPDRGDRRRGRDRQVAAALRVPSGPAAGARHLHRRPLPLLRDGDPVPAGAGDPAHRLPHPARPTGRAR